MLCWVPLFYVLLGAFIFSIRVDRNLPVCQNVEMYSNMVHGKMFNVHCSNHTYRQLSLQSFNMLIGQVDNSNNFVLRALRALRPRDTSFKALEAKVADSLTDLRLRTDNQFSLLDA